MSSCQDALTNNLNTQLQNFDSTIVFALEKRRLRQIWKASIANRANRINIETNRINLKYDAGFYIQNNYPGISNEVIENLLSIHGLPNLNEFFRRKIVGYNTRQIASCPNQGSAAFCKDVSEVQEKTCCECGKAHSCNSSLGGCDAWTTDNCNLRSNVNIFKVQIDKEIKDAIDDIDRNIQSLLNAYNSFTQRNLLPLNDIGCCQSILFRNVSGDNIYFNDITNTCTLKK